MGSGERRSGVDRKTFLLLGVGALGGVGAGVPEGAGDVPGPLPELLAEGRVSAPDGEMPGGDPGVAPVVVPGRLPFRFRTSGYRALPRLAEGRRPWRDRPVPWARVTPDDEHTYLDRQGVIMYRPHRKARGYDQPVTQLQFGLGCLTSYRRERDPARKKVFLRRAKAQAERLIAKKTVTRGAWYFTFPFNFTHRTHKGISYRAPWYSGMAQGEALSLFVQLAEVDGVTLEEQLRYQTAADGAFASLLRADDDWPWVVNRDEDGHLWIQLYPMDPPETSDHTFNGMLFAALGLWDYARATGHPLARQLYDGALTTAAHFFPELRNPGGWAYYCRSHGIPTPTYHVHVVRLYRQLAWQTGSRRFARMARLLAGDIPKKT
ncbi:D-glucuronyl C5-epimerase family protein [Streptomyces sp. NPDC048172]|uniref:D-glucuronyl C5-epimerase family protein n=1 Tax=Streptomyces sp. NPDC048172 TaxID=3365505 RepID=UPI00371B8C72